MRGLKSRNEKRGKKSLVRCAEVRNLLQSNSLGLGTSELHNLLSTTKRPVRKCTSISKSNQILDSDEDDPQMTPSSPEVDVSAVLEKKRKVRGAKNSDDQLTAEVSVRRKSRSTRKIHDDKDDEGQRSPIADLDMIDQKLDEVSRTNPGEQDQDGCAGMFFF
jgi:hypothetical protein